MVASISNSLSNCYIRLNYALCKVGAVAKRIFEFIKEVFDQILYEIFSISISDRKIKEIQKLEKETESMTLDNFQANLFLDPDLFSLKGDALDKLLALAGQSDKGVAINVISHLLDRSCEAKILCSISKIIENYLQSHRTHLHEDLCNDPGITFPYRVNDEREIHSQYQIPLQNIVNKLKNYQTPEAQTLIEYFED